MSNKRLNLLSRKIRLAPPLRLRIRPIGRQGVKQNIYLTEDMIEEILTEARRQGRSLTHLFREAWDIARPMIEQWPDAPHLISYGDVLHPAAGHIRRSRKRRRS